jgi:hypothetical protein
MIQDPEAILDRAIGSSDRPNAGEVVLALLQLEKARKADRSSIPAASLMGNWRLYFVTPKKVKLGDRRLSGFYLPSFIPAAISFQPNPDGTIGITNQITIGLIGLKLNGPARYDEKKRLLAFDFTQLEVSVLGKKVYEGKFPGPRQGKNFDDIPIGRLPFFSFFQVTDRFVAARGRGGGLAIWVKATASSVSV